MFRSVVASSVINLILQRPTAQRCAADTFCFAGLTHSPATMLWVGDRVSGLRSELMDGLLREYFPVLIFLAIAIGISVAMLVASGILAKQKPDSE